MDKFTPILLIPVLFLAALAMTCEGLTERDVYSVLEDKGIPFDGVAVQKGAVDGMVKAIDPRARILSSEEIVHTPKKPALDKVEEWPDGICYLKLNGLYEDGITDMVARIRSPTNVEPAGLILDLRGSSGDSLKAVDAVASLFAPDGSELYAIRGGRDRMAEKHVARNDEPISRRIPVMLAIDGDTRDASEILAAVLKGRARVMLIGSRTRGNVALREIVRISAEESLYIATRWVVLAGTAAPITNGVEPDVAVTQYTRTALPDKAPLGRQLSEKSKRDRELMDRVLGDAVLGSATDILLGLKALGLHATTTNTPSSTGK